ncbi:MAG: hypothetical protein PHF00_06080 [Elusimicrobia bacterium]|nr:hypothetical protein [Elusimicrobiota bacterium]
MDKEARLGLGLLILCLAGPPVQASRFAAANEVVDGSNADDVRSSLRFTINNDQDRVGAALDLCVPAGPDQWRTCRSVVFYFPQLAFDKSSREIKLGDEVLAKRSFWPWNRWRNPRFRLEYSRTRRLRDLGFDRAWETVYTAYLDMVPE